MGSGLSFSCDCGTVTGMLGHVGPKQGNRYVCYCSDCRDSIRHLGHAEAVLDAHGGVSLYQSRCGTMHIHTGKAELACLHMTDGPLLRWYAKCCNTPMFNSYKTAKFPFITTITYCCDKERLDQVLGPPIGDIFFKEATHPLPEPRPTSAFATLRRWFPRAVRDWLSGDFRHAELFDSETLQPIATPRRLTAQERAAIAR